MSVYKKLAELSEMSPERPWELLHDYTERGQAAQNLAVACLKALPTLLADRVQAESMAAAMLVDLRKLQEESDDAQAVLREQLKIERKVAQEMLDERHAELVRVRVLLAEARDLLEIHGHYNKTPHPTLAKLRGERL